MELKVVTLELPLGFCVKTYVDGALVHETPPTMDRPDIVLRDEKSSAATESLPDPDPAGEPIGIEPSEPVDPPVGLEPSEPVDPPLTTEPSEPVDPPSPDL